MRPRCGEMSKDAERYAEVRRLFLEAIELAEDERDQFLDEACGADSELRDELDSLLKHFLPSDLPKRFRNPS